MIRTSQLSRAFAAIALSGSLFGFATVARPATPDEAAAVSDSAASLSIAPLRVEVDSSADGATDLV